MEWVSKRDCHELCCWWERDESEETLPDELIMKRPPNGYFHAKEVTAETYDNGMAGGSFMFDRASVTIRTPDDITGIKNNCLVKYQDDKWLVVSVQRKNIRNGMTEFAPESRVPHFWYLQLRR